MTQLQIWYCTSTGKYEVRPQSLVDRRELYEWSTTNISAFRDEPADPHITYSSSTVDGDGVSIWKRVPIEIVPEELKALALLAL